MRTLSRHSASVVFAAAAIGAAALLGLAGWPQPHRTLEFCGVILAAILISILTVQSSAAHDRAAMPLSFVIDLTSLLLFGPQATMAVAGVGAITSALEDSPRSRPLLKTV